MFIKNNLLPIAAVGTMVLLPLVAVAQIDKKATKTTAKPTEKTPTRPIATTKTATKTEKTEKAEKTEKNVEENTPPANYYGDSESRTFGIFKAGKTAYTLATDVNLREQPTADGKVVATIPIATAVKIEEQLEKTYKKNGFAAPWHKVSFTDNTGAKKTGFVWGGMLTQTVINTKQTDGTVFLLGLTSYNKEKRQGVLQLRAARNGVELTKMEMKSRATFEESGMYVQGVSLGTAGFTKGINDVLVFGIGYEACGYTQSDRVVMWDGKQFYDGWEATSGADAGAYAESNTMIFPNEKEGKPQSIVVKYESTTYDESEKATTTRSQWTYKWNGKKFVKM